MKGTVSMHPLRIGIVYGLIAAAVQVLTVQINNQLLNKNGWVGFVGTLLLPIVALYLAGHYAGRHERLNIPTNIASGMRSTLHGLGAGIVAGLVFIILVGVANYLPLPYKPSNGDIWGVLGAIGYVLGLVGWPLVGIILGTIGGALGDNLAHRQLQSGKIQPATPATPPAQK
jgi:hypothetical protein